MYISGNAVCRFKCLFQSFVMVEIRRRIFVADIGKIFGNQTHICVDFVTFLNNCVNVIPFVIIKYTIYIVSVKTDTKNFDWKYHLFKKYNMFDFC